MKKEAQSKQEFNYGYIIVFAGVIIMLATFAVNYTFGIFFKPLVAEFGSSRAGTSLIYSFLTIEAGLLGILAGRLSDRFGARIVLTFTGICLGAGALLMSRITELWHAYLVATVFAIGIGASWPVLLPMVPRWFQTRKGLMSGVLTSGIGLGMVVGPLAATLLLQHFDWRNAYIMVGIAAIVVMVAAAQFLRNKKGGAAQSVPDKRAEMRTASALMPAYSFSQIMRTRTFALLCIIYFCFGFCLHTTMVHIVPMATDLHIEERAAAAILSVIGLGSIGGKVLTGGVSDKIGVKITLNLSFILLFVALAWVQFTGTLWTFYLFGILFALAYGGVMALQSLIIVDHFGLAAAGVTTGVVTFAYTIGGALGPFITGLVFDLSGNYSLAFIIAGLLALLAAVTVLAIKRPKVLV